jgi:hypothetical protein
VPDPADKTLITVLGKQLEEQQRIAAFLLNHAGEKDALALQAVRELDRSTASVVCKACGWSFQEVAGFNLGYKNFSQWNDLVCRASGNGNLVKLCKAAIALDIGTRTTDPLTAAKIATGTIRTDA